MQSGNFDNIISLYLDEIGKTDLLSPEEELDLAKKTVAGCQISRDRLVQANLRLVVKLAKEYADSEIPLADLISEGNIGLIKAVERYDPTKGGRLSSYAVWWIRQGINRALAYQGKVIRLPVHVMEKISRVRRIRAMMAAELGREPNDEELSDVLGISRKKLTLLQVTSLSPASLDAPLNDGEMTSLAEIIGDEDRKNPDEELNNKILRKELRGLLGLLDEREVRVIVARFGLNDERALTLEEIGAQFGITRERIRQIQKGALEKMRDALRRKDSPKPIPFKCASF